ncbi:MAG: adenylate kinase [Tatlockia sp.]|nr:adenylate kinase [Tatlockia sp.]
MIVLSELGKRICIIGCSSSGKSTLANALSKTLNIPAFHLDQYAHIENTNWQRSSDAVLIGKHNQIIHQDAWIIDGNYSVCMNQRLQPATSVIWLDPNVLSSVFRFITRSIKNDPNRPGRLAGVQNDFGFWLINYMLFTYPKNRIKYQKLLNNYPALPVLRIESMKLLQKYYNFWGI